MLVTAKKILETARANRYAVPGFNCIADVMVRGILDRAEALRMPVFVMLYPIDMDERDWRYMSVLTQGIAPYYDIPIVLHLDHASDLPTIQKALDYGFTSVMYDGSNLPFEQNAELTARVVELAKPYGASVEAELGLVGGIEACSGSSAENVLTQPDEVVKFVEQTGVDSLAVSIGTSHGPYKMLPQLDIPLLEKLDAASTVPLVLHGGSGTPDDQVRAAVEHGICKFNVYTDSRVALWRRFRQLATDITRQDPLPKDYIAALQEALGDIVEEKSRLAGVVGRAN